MPHTQQTTRPSILFVFADQMRGTDMGCAGNPQVHTPNMDRLAAEGAMFTTAVSCFPVCTPHRGCLISGRYPTTTGVMDNDVPLPIDGRGLGHCLKTAGYRTGWIGKWHLFGPEEVRQTYIPPGEHRHGFDDLWAGLDCSHRYFDHFYYLNDSPERISFRGYEPDVQTDLALEFLHRNRGGAPSALFLSWGPPHDPYDQVPETWREHYRERDLGWRPNVDPQAPLICHPSPGNMRNPNFSLPAMYRAYEQDPELQALPNPAVVRDYYAAISALDHNLGRLLTGLDELGLADDTIVVFTSDHGDMMYSQRAAQKNHPWDESLLVPFLIRYPAAIPAGTRISAPFNTVDILPTLLELAGVAAPEFAEGTSFAGAVRGLDQSLPEAAYILCAWPWILPEWRGIRTEDHTYVEAHAGPLLLFDNRNDPYQMENLVNRPEHRDLQERLRRVYRRMAAQVGDPFDPWPVVRERMERTREAWRHRHAHLLETAR